ncbi:murein hydrolase activator EnvC [Adlercreutzia sp. ZJ473]|uniref:murein hydrolase activator EnvC family protein n=1 Tax=Adlercreutzia sp. ZJ473 TaxID=2722822 RepID=UPI001555B2B1|nr:M23 family metallopeptidase [Adlercreutzia sp. ZJ473]
MTHENTRRTPVFRRIGLCVVAASLSLACVPASSAFAVSEAERDALQAEADALFVRIDALQTELNQANVDYENAVVAHDEAVEAMDEAQARIDAAEARIAELQERLGDRANSMYKTGGSSSLLDVLLGASSFEEFLTSWDMIERITSQDAALVQETKDVRAEAEAAHAEYAEQERIASEQMQKSLDLKNEIASTQAALKVEADSITAEVAEMQAQIELQAEAARQAAEAAAAAEAARQAQMSAANSGGSGSNSFAGASAGSSVVVGSGTLSNPCPAASTSSGYGWRAFDNSFHKGTDMAAPEGTPYYAAESGTVIYATNDGGYNGGAGNWVVIAHGNGMVTKYMHSSAVFVSPGQTVSRGQNIGLVGNTGQSFGAHLHFQVEVNGVAVNPHNYF